MDEARSLLDSLMGKNRNLAEDEEPEEQQHWTDEDVCPYFLCGFCPHSLFTNTRSDLGPCNYIHQEELREQFEKEPTRTRRRLERRFLSFLHECVADVDRRINRGKARIALHGPSADPSPQVLQQLEDKKKNRDKRVEQLDEEMATLKQQMEQLCEEGHIDDAEAMLRQVEKLEKEKTDLQNMQFDVPEAPLSKDNNFQICEICGVFQAIDDAEDRILRHYDGKQHVGYDAIRNKIKELEEAFRKDDEERSESRDKYRSRDSGGRRSEGRRDRDHSRDRERDRDRRRHHSRNDKSRDYDRRRRRSRSRERRRY